MWATFGILKTINPTENSQRRLSNIFGEIQNYFFKIFIFGPTSFNAQSTVIFITEIYTVNTCYGF